MGGTRKSLKDLGFLCWDSSFSIFVWRSVVGGFGVEMTRVYDVDFDRRGTRVILMERN